MIEHATETTRSSIRRKIATLISATLVVSLASVIAVGLLFERSRIRLTASERIETTANVVRLDFQQRRRIQQLEATALAGDDLFRRTAARSRGQRGADNLPAVAERLAALVHDAGYSHAALYDVAGNLLTFAVHNEGRRGWRTGPGAYAGPGPDGAVHSVDPPSFVPRVYDGDIPDESRTRIRRAGNFLLLESVGLLFHDSILDGFVGLGTILDGDYASTIARLANTPVRFYVGDSVSAGSVASTARLTDGELRELRSLYDRQIRKPGAGWTAVPRTLTIDGTRYFSRLYPLGEDASLLGAMEVLYPQTAVDAAAGTGVFAIILAGALAACVGILAVLRVSDRIIEPIRRAVDVTNRLAEGDLTVDLDGENMGDDEGWQLIRAMDHMIERLRLTVGKVTEAVDNVDSFISDVSASVQEEMAVATQQSAAVTEITATMEEIAASSTEIAANSGAVLEIASKTLEDVKHGAGMVEGLMGKLYEVNEDSEQNTREIVDLGRKSQEISKIMTLINTIADQTKLIAFNAALEAAAAGDAGKRFGVVASEIRRLADSVTESTSDIHARIDEIQASVNRLVVTAEKGSRNVAEGITMGTSTVEMLADIVGGAEETAGAAKQIQLATQQQKTANEQVVVSLREILDGAKQISASIEQTGGLNSRLADMAGELRTLVRSFRLPGQETGSR